MPTPLIVILAALAAVILLLSLRVRLILLYQDTLRVRLRVAVFGKTLLPAGPPDPRKFSPAYSKKKAARAARKRAKKEARARKKAKKRSTTGGTPSASLRHGIASLSLPEKLELVRALLSALIRATRKRLKLRAAKLHLFVASEDAATTAILCGTVSAALAGVLATLEAVCDLTAHPPDVAVIPDYLAEKPRADIKIVCSMRLLGALLSLVALAFTFLRVRRAQKKKESLSNTAPTTAAAS